MDEKECVVKGGSLFKWKGKSVDTRDSMKMARTNFAWSKAHWLDSKGRKQPVRFRGMPQSARMIDNANICYWKLVLKASPRQKPHDIVKNCFINLS